MRFRINNLIRVLNSNVVLRSCYGYVCLSVFLNEKRAAQNFMT